VNTTSSKTVAFVTSAWERDWEVVLWPERYEMIVKSHCRSFPIRLIVLNNFASQQTQLRAMEASNVLIQLGLATDVIHAPSYLDSQVLSFFEIPNGLFWERNPYYSTNHIAALHWMQGKADYLFHMAGDIWLDRACDWIPRALGVLDGQDRIRGLNLCRNIYTDLYSKICHEEMEAVWLSNPRQKAADTGVLVGEGFSLSDIAYVIRVSPAEGWRFDVTDEDLNRWYPRWPIYARPCFEMYYRIAMERYHFSHGTLKPIGGGPLTKHKNFPASQSLKIKLQKWLGFYSSGGKYAPRDT
jgi:hypothetical protein